MLEKLRKLNPHIRMYSIHDKIFEKYGRVLNIDAQEIIDACGSISIHKDGAAYEPSVANLEALGCSELLSDALLGGCNTEIGICHGQNSHMNGLEFHKSSEINIAVTPLVLILGLKDDMVGDKYCSNNVVAFYAEKGEVLEMYSTTLHYCPCQVDDNGFFSVVVLPEKTNTPLERETNDKLLRSKNKWIICHEKCDNLIGKGIYPGIYGPNYEIIYK